MTFAREAAALAPDLITLRRALHRDPEIGLALPRTRQRVLDALAGLPAEITTSDANGSVVAVITGTAPARQRHAVFLRGDMDALPVREETGLDYTASGDAMHACGHDLHTAMLAGAARLLAARRDELAGDVVLLFQPGEEGYEGAAAMIEAGALEASPAPAVAAYALHVTSARFGHGAFATRPGPLMAASDILRVTVRGRGGHASAPHEALDPIPVAAEMVTALQTIVTRAIDTFEPVVITVGMFRGGIRENVISDDAEFSAAVRTFGAATRSVLIARVTALCEGIAAAHGLAAEVTWEQLYPVTVNDPAEAQFLLDTAAALFGPDAAQVMATPMTGSEDFSRILQRIPGALAFLGATPEGTDPRAADFNHSAHAVFDDDVLPRGAALLAELARARLAAAAQG
ncbi:MAG TPA: M20 family metallopeptidase [Trebonia sp.]|nr:M20 family metallopeptidase [Trebonia sp.]